MTDGHPRHELEKDADALAEVAQFADYLAHNAFEGDPDATPPVEPDSVAGERCAHEADILRNWEQLLRLGKAAT